VSGEASFAADCRNAISWLDEVREFDAAVSEGRLKLLFSVGMARSGTTWLHELLAQHPDVRGIGESYIFTEYLKSMPAALRKFTEGMTNGLARILPATETARSLRPMVFWALIRAVPDWRECKVISEKTPDTENVATFLLQVVPEAYVLHIVRDPRAVIASWRAGSRTWSRAWKRYRSIELSYKWTASVACRSRISAITDRFHTVRYEDLHADGVGSLRAIFAWLGVAASEEACAAFVEACRIERMRVHPASDREAEPADASRRRWTHDFLRRGYVGGWEADLSPREIARIEHVAREPMGSLGYQPTTRRRSWLPSVALYHASFQMAHRVRKLALRLRR
jgi:hypothetical protein